MGKISERGEGHSGRLITFRWRERVGNWMLTSAVGTGGCRNDARCRVTFESQRVPVAQPNPPRESNGQGRKRRFWTHGGGGGATEKAKIAGVPERAGQTSKHFIKSTPVSLL